MEDFIRGLPKVELHLHIEGSLEPELMFELAERNKVKIPFSSCEEIRQAYHFTDLQSFLDIYYQGMQVLLHEQDFFDLTWAYLQRCRENNVIHTEIFFDPQAHTGRGVPFVDVVNGIYNALQRGEKELGITSSLIMSFLRDLSEDSAIETLKQAQPHMDKIIGVGLDSSERGHPPENFQKVFKMARNQGFKAVAHAGEEGPASNIWNAINLLKVSRIDHGTHCVDDPKLVEELVRTRMPLTVCPLSNLKLQVITDIRQHQIITLLQKGVCVSIHADDPAYFGGYITDNFLLVAEKCSMTKEEAVKMSLNAIEASFISDDLKKQYSQTVNDYYASNKIDA